MLQEQRIDIFYEMGGVLSENYYLEAGKSDGIIKRIRDAIDKIIKRIKEFFVKTKDPKELVEVPQNAVKETKSFLDKAKKVLNNIGAKMKNHPKATAAALVSLTAFSVATVWKKSNEKKILTTCERQKINDLIKESDEIIKEARKEAETLFAKNLNELNSVTDNQLKYLDGDIDTETFRKNDNDLWKKYMETEAKRGKAWGTIEREFGNMKRNNQKRMNSTCAEIHASNAKIYQVITLIGTLVSALIVAAK